MVYCQTSKNGTNQVLIISTITESSKTSPFAWGYVHWLQARFTNIYLDILKLEDFTLAFSHRSHFLKQV